MGWFRVAFRKEAISSRNGTALFQLNPPIDACMSIANNHSEKQTNRILLCPKWCFLSASKPKTANSYRHFWKWWDWIALKKLRGTDGEKTKSWAFLLTQLPAPYCSAYVSAGEVHEWCVWSSTSSLSRKLFLALITASSRSFHPLGLSDCHDSPIYPHFNDMCVHVTQLFRDRLQLQLWFKSLKLLEINLSPKHRYLNPRLKRTRLPSALNSK